MKSEVSTDNNPQWRSSVFFLYLVAKTLYDIRTDPDAALTDFCFKFYGAAAAESEAFHRLNQKIFSESLGKVDCGYPRISWWSAAAIEP